MDTPSVAFSNETTVNGAGPLFGIVGFGLGLGGKTVSLIIPALFGLAISLV